MTGTSFFMPIPVPIAEVQNVFCHPLSAPQVEAFLQKHWTYQDYAPLIPTIDHHLCVTAGNHITLLALR